MELETKKKNPPFPILSEGFENQKSHAKRQLHPKEKKICFVFQFPSMYHHAILNAAQRQEA